MDALAIQRLKSLTILYVEDEDKIRTKIADTLRFYVKKIITAKNGEEGYDLYLRHKPDVILSDILMPIVDGLEMVKMIRKEDIKTPIVMITAHTEKEYLLDAVKLHLENYLVKPISLHDILTALNTCLEKFNIVNSLSFNLPKGYSYDMGYKALTYNGNTIKLSKKEITFLELLMKNISRVVRYEEFQEEVWGNDIMTDNAVRSIVNGLRKKLPNNIITNLSGIGYKLEND
jgi:DNA-binding response OmpR family regulator